MSGGAGFGPGLDGLMERSRRPLRSPNQTQPELEDEIVRLRKELPLDNGAEMIGWQLRRQGRDGVPSDRTIHRVLVRRGMVHANLRSGPRALIDGSNTTGRMSAGRSTPPTGGCTAVARSRSWTSSMTTPGSLSRSGLGLVRRPAWPSRPSSPVVPPGASGDGPVRQRHLLRRGRSGRVRVRTGARRSRDPSHPLPALSPRDLRQGRTFPRHPQTLAHQTTAEPTRSGTSKASSTGSHTTSTHERRSSAGGELTPAERHHHSTAAGHRTNRSPSPPGHPRSPSPPARSAPTVPSASPAGSPASAPNTPADASPSSATAPRPSSSTEPPSSPAPTSTPTAATSPAADQGGPRRSPR